jgi:hypothetical protein
VQGLPEADQQPEMRGSSMLCTDQLDTAVKIKPLENLDFDFEKAIVCEVRWVDRDEEDVAVECGNPGKYSAIGHDEIHDHGNHQLVICQSCVDLLLRYGSPCECGSKLLFSITPL